MQNRLAERGEGLWTSDAIGYHPSRHVKSDYGPLGDGPEITVSDDTQSGLQLLDGAALLTFHEDAIGIRGRELRKRGDWRVLPSCRFVLRLELKIPRYLTLSLISF